MSTEWIKGYVHVTEDEAFLANVHIVKDIRRHAGVEVGWMELTDGSIVRVAKHPAGNFYGQIFRDEEAAFGA